MGSADNLVPREPGSTYPGCHHGKPDGMVDGKGYNPAPPKCQSIQVKRCKGVAERYGPLLQWAAVPSGTGCNWVAVPLCWVQSRLWHRCNEGCIGMHMGPMCLRAHRAQAQLSIPGVLVLCARTWSEWLRILGQIPPGQTPGEYCTLHGLPPHFSLIHL